MPLPSGVAPVTDDSAAQPVTATGVVALRDEIALSFKIGGVVSQVLVREGESVRAGQLLATLDLREIDAQVSKAQSAATKAERDLARIRPPAGGQRCDSPAARGCDHGRRSRARRSPDRGGQPAIRAHRRADERRRPSASGRAG